MKALLKNSILLLMALLICTSSVAQKKAKQERVRLERADELEGGNFRGKSINKFKGNVALRQGEIMFYCDSAYQYNKKQERNTIEAFGNVRVQQGDTLLVTGDRLIYNGDKKKARISRNVIFQKGKKVKQYRSLIYKFK